MTTFIRLLFLFLFASLMPLCILFFGIRLSGMSIEVIKQQLRDANVYEKLQQQLIATISTSSDTALIVPVVKKEITAEYIEGKIETLIDDTDAWASGKTTQEPSISFVDLKQKLTGGNQKMLAQYTEMAKQLEEEMKKQQQEIIDQMKKDGSSDQIKDIPQPDTLDIEKIINSDATYPLGKYLRFIKPLYMYFRVGLTITLTLMAISLFIIFLLSNGLTAKYRWLAATLLFTTIAGLPVMMMLYGLHSAIPQAASSFSGIPAIIAPFIIPLIQPIISGMKDAGTYLIGGSAVTGSVLFILSFMTTPAPVVQPATTKAKPAKKKS